MRKRDLEKLQKMLLMERQQIIQHLHKLENDSNRQISEMKGDDLDIASIEISQAALSKLGGRERKLLSKIDHALAKFEEGEYGICELTGEQIPIKRLMARPVAQYTVEAKAELETREKRYRENAPDEDNSDFDEFE